MKISSLQILIPLLMSLYSCDLDKFSHNPSSRSKPTRQVVVNHVSLPVRADAPEMCTNPGILDIVSKIRRQCIKGKCDIDKLLDESNTISREDFYKLIREVDYNKLSFFFKSGETEISQSQKEAKSPRLQAILSTMIADRTNTIAFIIAKASKTGKKLNNRMLSTRRAASVFNMIDELFSKNSQTYKCQHIYRTYVGDELFQISPKIAQRVGYIEESDIKLKGKEKLINYVNQSAIVFTYPCFKEMCHHMKTIQGLSCNENSPSDQQLPEECIELICER